MEWIKIGNGNPLPEDFEVCLVTCEFEIFGETRRKVTIAQFDGVDFDSMGVDNYLFDPEFHRVIAWAHMPEPYGVQTLEWIHRRDCYVKWIWD